MTVWPSRSHIAAISSRSASAVIARSASGLGEARKFLTVQLVVGVVEIHCTGLPLAAHSQNCHLASGARSDRHESGVARRLQPKAKTAAGVCVHQIEMSLFLPFRNVTSGSGSDGGRARSPGVAQRPTDARGMDV